MANAFFVRCDCRNRRFTGGKSRFLQEADGRKGIASAADELCGSALNIRALGLFKVKNRLMTAGIDLDCARVKFRLSKLVIIALVAMDADGFSPDGQGPVRAEGDLTLRGRLVDQVVSVASHLFPG